MRKQLTKITLGFENCEAIDIPAEYLTYLYMSGYNRQVTYRRTFDEYYEIEMYDEVLMEINPKLDTESQDNLFNEEDGAIARIKNFSDITSIDLHYVNDAGEKSIKEYYVTWKEKHPYWNEYQSSHTNSVGNLCIKISEKTPSDYIKERDEYSEMFSWFEWEDWKSEEGDNG